MTIETREEIDLVVDTISELDSMLEDFQTEEENTLEGVGTTDPDPMVKLARFNRKELKAARHHLEKVKGILAGVVEQNH